MKLKSDQSNQDMSLPADAPAYLKKLNAKWANDKVGQTFIAFINRPSKDQKNSTKPATN